MIKLSKVTKKFGNVIAVKDLSLEIKKGEIVALLGPNGAGKTTTMRIITGFLVPDEGDVFIDENEVSYEFPKNLIGYMPESNPLYKDMLVKDALKYILDLYKIPTVDHQARIDYIVNATNLQKVFNKPINQLSKGYKQRVGLALVLIHDPQILILDEPTEGLDPNQRLEIRNLIKSKAEDKTIIISTHVMQEVEAMCTRVVIINDGQIILDKNIKDLSKTLEQKKINLEEYFRELTLKNGTKNKK